MVVRICKYINLKLLLIWLYGDGRIVIDAVLFDCFHQGGVDRCGPVCGYTTKGKQRVYLYRHAGCSALPTYLSCSLRHFDSLRSVRKTIPKNMSSCFEYLCIPKGYAAILPSKLAHVLQMAERTIRVSDLSCCLKGVDANTSWNTPPSAPSPSLWSGVCD
jgi:hypothetical protein